MHLFGHTGLLNPRVQFSIDLPYHLSRLGYQLHILHYTQFTLHKLWRDHLCGALTRHPVSGKGVTNLRTINLLTYIILKNYLENINLQKISYTSIVVVFTVSCTYILSPIYLYFYICTVSKILHLHLQNRVKPTCRGLLQLC